MITELIKRRCENNKCFKIFKVFPNSENKYCSEQCAISCGAIQLHPREIWKRQEQIRQAEMSERLSKKYGPKVSSTVAGNGRGSGIGSGSKIRSLEPKRKSAESSDGPITKNEKENRNENTITEQRTRTMREERNGSQETGNGNELHRENTIVKIENDSSPSSSPTETSETLPVLSGDSSRRLRSETLGSMRLLSKSSNRLMNLMEESVSDVDLEKSKEGVQRVEPHKIRQAIDAANALAATVQVQANLIKSAAMFFKDSNDA